MVQSGAMLHVALRHCGVLLETHEAVLVRVRFRKQLHSHAGGVLLCLLLPHQGVPLSGSDGRVRQHPEGLRRMHVRAGKRAKNAAHILGMDV